ncbi:MAG: SGNH/GDSL hydrolase family protein [Ramlibacter sp.]|nr:SGNH/GDSL hydrolase family protein [Ramlibacter sp.]
MRPATVAARCWLCTLLAVLCAGCGGGSQPSPPAPQARIIEFYGDSLTFGSIEGLAGELTRLAVPPVRRAQELLDASAVCMDLSLPGATVADALAGVAMMPFGVFSEHVRTTQASTLVIRYGGADAMRGTPLADFERDLEAMVSLAKKSHKLVLLVGVIATPSGVTDDYDLAVERVADAHGTGFVDVRAVSVTFPDDLADAVHPAQAWSDRITAAIVRHLQPQP